jgi:hypothetical protein
VRSLRWETSLTFQCSGFICSVSQMKSGLFLRLYWVPYTGFLLQIQSPIKSRVTEFRYSSILERQELCRLSYSGFYETCGAKFRAETFLYLPQGESEDLFPSRREGVPRSAAPRMGRVSDSSSEGLGNNSLFLMCQLQPGRFKLIQLSRIHSAQTQLLSSGVVC